MSQPAPTGLMCEMLASPEKTTIADDEPEFGWIVNSDIQNDEQTAYRILVASSIAILQQDQGDLWDSDKVLSDNSVNIEYQGSPLTANSSYYWKVRIWNKQNQSSDWSAAQKFTMAPTIGGYSTARYPLQKTPVSPASISFIEDGHYLADFGKDAFSYLNLKFGDAQTLLDIRKDNTSYLQVATSSEQTGLDGQIMTIHFGEKLEDGLVDRTPGGTIRYYQLDLALDNSILFYEVHPPGTTTGIPIPPEIGRIAPFRYCEFVNCPIPLEKKHLQQVTIHYPFDESASAFQCDNATLNQVWELCKYSIKATSFAAVYVDGDRERKPYEADAYINQLCHYASDREFSLARYSHEYLMTHPTWPTEWLQHSIMMAWADYMYTGSTESLAANYDSLKNDKLLQQYARGDGLIDPSTTDIVDWPSGERDGFDFEPINTVVNAFYYHTLLLMKQIAEALGKTADAQQFQLDAEQVYQSFQSVFFDTGTEIYVDGEGTTHSSLHANMFPLAFGLVPEDKKPAVVDFVKSRGMACSVYGAQYLMEALYRAGEEDYALSLMTSTATRSWMNMIAVGSTITLEAWDIQYKSNLDWNHAWGAAPGNIIPRFVMGIQPAEPGFKKVLIHPRPGSLQQAQITVPTIRGAVSVSMDKQAQTCIFQITIPVNMTAKFVIPKNCDAFDTVLLDGNPVQVECENGHRIIDPLDAGSHTITLE